MLKQISKDVKETARIQGSMDENTFLQFYGKLCNTTNTNELQLEYNSADYSHAFTTLDGLEKALKLTKNGKSTWQDNINSELYKYAPEQFKLRLLQFLNNIYRENRIPNEWRNAVITKIFRKGDRGEPKYYRRSSILNICYKIYSTILNMNMLEQPSYIILSRIAYISHNTVPRVTKSPCLVSRWRPSWHLLKR